MLLKSINFLEGKMFNDQYKTKDIVYDLMKKDIDYFNYKFELK